MATRLDNIIKTASANPTAKANKALIDALYMEFFNRMPTENEYKRFGSMSAKDATNVVAGREIVKAGAGEDVGYEEGNQLTDGQKAEIDKLNSDIDAMDLSIEQKAILKEIASGEYTSGNTIPTTEELGQIIDDAAQNAETDLAPYYEKITGREIEDLKTEMERIRGEATRYTEREATDYASKLKQTKQSLRARGLTFSGKSVQQLGREGFVKSDREGELETIRRQNLEEQMAGYQKRAEDLGVAAERELGSSSIKGMDFGTLRTPYSTSDLYTARGNVSTGDLELERLKETEKSKWDRVSKLKNYI